jgi:CheY-like chemotaxis protein
MEFKDNSHNMATILVIEDNEMNLDMLSRRLSKRGHEVLIATDGAQGVDLAQQHKPDLILMDMSLPIMDGWQATRIIKANPDLKHIPVIALTAHAIAGDREKCLAAGCDEYESKPIKFPELMAKIDHFLGISE